METQCCITFILKKKKSCYKVEEEDYAALVTCISNSDLWGKKFEADTFCGILQVSTIWEMDNISFCAVVHYLCLKRFRQATLGEAEPSYSMIKKGRSRIQTWQRGMTAQRPMSSFLSDSADWCNFPLSQKEIPQKLWTSNPLNNYSKSWTAFACKESCAILPEVTILSITPNVYHYNIVSKTLCTKAEQSCVRKKSCITANIII